MADRASMMTAGTEPMWPDASAGADASPMAGSAGSLPHAGYVWGKFSMRREREA